MIKAKKKDTGSMVYMRFIKHDCPKCQSKLKVVKMVKVVKSNTKEAKNFDFTACDISLGDRVKFIWYEFKCPSCGARYKEADLKTVEKAAKKDAKAAARAVARQQRLGKRSAQKNKEESAE